jgi:MFS transporter, DHA2 family, multidrug resistance protein
MSTAPVSFSAPAALNPADLPTRTKVFAFTLMCIGFFMATLDIQIVASSLRDIGGGLSASQDELSWVQTSYLIAEIIVIPMSGWLTRVFSTRWVFTFSSFGFTVTSMLCGMAWNIDSMIVFRGLQGALGAAMIPTVFTSAFVLFPPRQRLIASTTIGALATLAPTIGPVIGGWITSQWSWHWLFYLNLVPGVAVTLLVPRFVDFDRADLSLVKRGDYAGIALMSGFLGCLEYVLEEGPRKNWFGDDVIVACTWIAAICGFLFIVRAFTANEPIVDLRALAQRNFGIGSLLSFITGIGIFCAVFLTPIFLGRVRGFDSLQIGIALLSVGCFQVLGLIVYSLLARFIDMRKLLLFGLVCFGAGCYLYVPLTSDWGWQQLLLPQALRGIGQQFCIPPIVTMALGSLPPSRLRSASGLFNLMRNLGGAIGIAVANTMLNDRLNLHYERLAEHASVGRPLIEALMQRQTALLRATGQTIDAAHAGLALLNNMLMREALTLTFADTFLALASCFVVALVAALFSRPFGNAAPPPDAH